ncbi:Ig domain-containing protein [Roseateles sp. YR242]|uniref:Ig domain-containing protein n=1 Tax=Roseateles sp. YR242 TaxID=1855305 RepID=UPI001C431026|nr:Ig domain-containing protein [Roseateles sp. YR242]
MASTVAARTPCVHCRRWRVFLGGMLAAAIGLALHATAGPPSMGPPVAPKRVSLAEPPSVGPGPGAATAGAKAESRHGATAPGMDSGAQDGGAQGSGAQGSGALDATATTYPLEPAPPPRETAPTRPQAATAAAVAPSAPAAPPARRTPDLRLVYVTVPLPAGRINSSYKRREVVQGGRPPYRIEIEGTPPPGLVFGADGYLSGTPTRAGQYSFTLRAEDSATPSMEQEQHYVLRILDPVPATAAPSAKAPAPAPVASAPDPRLRAMSLQEADGAADLNGNVPVSYLLTAKELDELVPPSDDDKVKPTATAIAPSPPLPALAALRADLDEDPAVLTEPPLIVPDKPTNTQLRGLLTPVVGVEYPTRAMFIRAIEAERCRYYLQRVGEVAAARKLPAPTSCPAPAAQRPEPVPAPKRNERRPDNAAVPLEVFFDSLLAEDNLRDIVAVATKLHPVGNSRPLLWTADGCQCAPDHKDNQVVGVIPFWAAQETPMPINFNLFTRLQYMGVVLRDDGSFDLPKDWDGAVSGYAREAQRYDVAMDLVLYRRTWNLLLNRSAAEQDRMIEEAVTAAVRMVDRRSQDRQSLMNKLLLAPGSDETNHVFSGLTVFFEDTPTDGAAQARYTAFLRKFMAALLERMANAGRPYYLNLVVPDDQLKETGPYSYEWLMSLKLKAELASNPRHRTAVDGSKELSYEGKSDITVKFLIMLSGDPDSQKKDLRRRVDLTRQLQGVRRIDFLDSVLPVLVHATSPEAPPTNVAATMARDFPYIEWTYGGITLWPLPRAEVGMGPEVIPPLKEYFTARLTFRQEACAWICPNRMPLRLVTQFLLMAWIVAAAVYVVSCRARRIGLLYLVCLWAGALLLLLMAVALLFCDPALAPLRDNPYVPAIVALAFVAMSGYLVFRPGRPEL